MRTRFLWIIIIVLIVLSVPTVMAQANLLVNGGFEQESGWAQASAADDAVFNVPPGWAGVVYTQPRSETWMNLTPNGYPHFGMFKIEGGRSAHISRGFATFTASMFQTVTVPENANVQAAARGFMERKNDQGQNVGGGRFRVGIDPTGGSNPLSGNVIWGGWVNTVDGWAEATAAATAIGTRVTMFLFATQDQPAVNNGIYWDDARLTVGGAGAVITPVSGTTTGPTATPVIPTPAFASFVVPQSAQSDGSIVHTVQAGDTLDAIAVAYGTTRDEILQINNLASARFLQIGQKLIIRPARPSSAGSEDSSETPESTTSATRSAAVSTTQPTQQQAQPTAEATAEATAEPTTESTPTMEPSPTLAAPTNTATEPPPAPVTAVAQARVGVTGVCVWMFNDANQNRIQEAGETLLPGGNIVVNQGDQLVKTYETDGASEPFCFDDIAPGNYVVSASAPDGFGLTTSAQLSLRVQSGATTDAKFGAAEGVTVAAAPPVDLNNQPPTTDSVQDQTVQTDNTNTLLQISGLIVFGLAALVLVGGIGVALIIRNR